MSNNTPTTGVTGNTQPQLNAAAGSSATNNLKTFWSKHKKVLGIALAAMFVYFAIVTFTSVDVGVGGLLVTGLIGWFISKQLAKKKPLSVASVIGMASIGLIVIVLLNTAFIQKPLEGINSLEKNLANISNCPGTKPVGVGGKFMIHKGCEKSMITVPMSLDPWYKIEDGRFAGEFANWFEATWDKHNGALIHIKPIKWPEGVDEVEVQILTKEQVQAEQDVDIISAALSGATK